MKKNNTARFPLNRRNRRKTVIREQKFKKKHSVSRMRKILSSITILLRNLFHRPKFLTIFLFLLLIILAFGGYWVYSTGYFNLTEIELVGNQIVDVESVKNVFSDIWGKNIFVVSPDKYETQVRELSNYIRDIHVEKVLPNKLSVQLWERTPVLVVRTVNGAYLVDDTGYVIERIVNDAVTLESISNEIIAQHNTKTEDGMDEEKLTVQEFNEMFEQTDELDENSEDENEQIFLVNLDPELEKQIELELLQRESELDLSTFDYGRYVEIPDSFKKYSSIKMWADDIYEIGGYIDNEIFSQFLVLHQAIVDKKIFKVTEIFIFSSQKVLLEFEEGWRCWLNMDKDANDQVALLELIYGKLKLEGVEFKEVDLRFARPVIRN